MAQEKIIEMLNKRRGLFASQIIHLLQISNEPKESIRKVLKQMRKYHDIKFVCIGIESREKHLYKYKNTDEEKIKWKIIKEDIIFKKFPELQKRIIVRKSPITRPCYLYFAK